MKEYLYNFAHIYLKAKKCYFGSSGFIRWNYWELNWDVRDWALPLSVNLSDYLVFIRVFCVGIIISKRGSL